MKVLVLNGSPKDKSDTMHITGAFLEGLNETHTCEIKTCHVIKMDIKPCLGCFACWKGDDAQCAQEDDMKGILEDIKWADLIIWSFPLYCYGMPAHLKAVCDRILSLSKLEMEVRDGRVHHKTKMDLSNKRYIMISGCGFPNFEGNFEPAVAQFRSRFGNNALSICISEAPMFNMPELDAVTKPKLEKVKAAGKEFWNTGNISEALLEEIATDMIPNNVYIANVNRMAL